MNEASPDQDKILAAQLRQPHGDRGHQLADTMNESNAGINRRVIELMALTSGTSVLEIGFGNGGFVGELLKQANGIRYTGLDWSQAMVNAARKQNQALKKAVFIHGASVQMPFASQCFDMVMSVNTLYFWENPEQDFAEIRRVLKPAGQVCIAFADKSFMSQLSFSQYNFKLYDKESVVDIIERSGFQIVQAETYEETGLSHTGEEVEKLFHILICSLGEKEA